MFMNFQYLSSSYFGRIHSSSVSLCTSHPYTTVMHLVSFQFADNGNNFPCRKIILQFGPFPRYHDFAKQCVFLDINEYS